MEPPVAGLVPFKRRFHPRFIPGLYQGAGMVDMLWQARLLHTGSMNCDKYEKKGGKKEKVSILKDIQF